VLRWFIEESFYNKVYTESCHYKNAFDATCQYVQDLSVNYGVEYANPQIIEGTAISYYDFFD